MIKVYLSLWVMTAVVAALLLLTGFMTLTAVVTFGFVIFGLVFMGMMGVLPATIAHPDHRERDVNEQRSALPMERRRVHRAQKSAHA